MIKNDINLIYKRKTKQYSSKSLAVTIAVVTVIGVGVFFGITLPTQNLSNTKRIVDNLDNELAQYSSIALSAGNAGTDEIAPADTTLEAILIGKSEKLASLNEQLTGLKLISTAESNALAYIYAVEESLPTEINIGNMLLSNKVLEIVGETTDDTALATFCLRLRETAMFDDVFVGGDTGAIAQVPTQLTVSRVKLWSSVVCPTSIPSFRQSSSSRSWAPRTWHAVPLQTWMTARPFGVRLKTL